MQKQTKKKLSLRGEVVRSLDAMTLKVVQGGAINPSVSICQQGDECETIHNRR